MHIPHLVAVLAAAAAGVANAHPGHDLSEEIAERQLFLRSVRRSSLAHCADKLKARGVEAANIARRSAAVESSRVARGIQRRDLDSDLSKSHNSTDLGYTENTSVSELFSSNGSCLLTPEVTQGPYYVGGESIRKDVTDSEPGIDITLDYQVIDVDTCEPVPDVYVEIWHCNSTGVYSGVVANGNGDSSDSSNLDNKALRGIQPTDQDGVAQFQSIFPGHYTGRATHIHVMVHANATLYANQTLGNEVYASHVGQAFFDQDLIAAADKVAPYSDNEQTLTENSDDSILAEEAGTEGVDPFMDYVYLGGALSDGLFAWLAFGINTTYSSEVTPAAFVYESGGVENENGGMGGPGGGGPPGGGAGGPPGGGNGTGPGSNTTAAPSVTSTAPSGTQTGTTGTPTLTNVGSVVGASVTGLLGLVVLVLVVQ
ncbi:extracellular dioxygenase [Cordyceps fumosorosea ARSEF 2679]|uniref:Extracellular dioxygenase n=1 Tax=Cordyceps fumosorosea (strain ARSEF 2679) TaxID=1081104 RepID=A0A168CPR0_CORFA|nr:extracellular dioxygenase [Cordyceps fumosorosea ARSEF 2679]OAA71640.1 extracellular dioxygenase [Cordyceps fumosorosea ARSEF 2679]